MRDAWRKLCPFSFKETKKTSENYDSIYLLIDEILENGKEPNLEMNAEDVVEFIYYPDPELTINELIELKKQSNIKEIVEDFEPVEKIMTIEN